MSTRTSEELCRSASKATRLIQGKWRIQICCVLREGPVRLGKLVRLIPTASKKVIMENLRQLERDGVVVRTDLSGALLHVEYGFSETFRTPVAAVLACLADLGDVAFIAVTKHQDK